MSQGEVRDQVVNGLTFIQGGVERLRLADQGLEQRRQEFTSRVNEIVEALRALHALSSLGVDEEVRAHAQEALNYTIHGGGLIEAALAGTGAPQNLQILEHVRVVRVAVERARDDVFAAHAGVLALADRVQGMLDEAPFLTYPGPGSSNEAVGACGTLENSVGGMSY